MNRMVDDLKCGARLPLCSAGEEAICDLFMGHEGDHADQYETAYWDSETERDLNCKVLILWSVETQKR